MAYDTAGVPHIAYLSASGQGPVRYAFRTNRWHIDTVPGSSTAVYTDLVLDDQGQPLIVFGTPDSGVWLAHGIGVVATEEPELPPGTVQDMQFAVHPNPCRGWAYVELSEPAAGDLDVRLFDVSGRVVRQIQLRAGGRGAAVDLRRLPAGVYFLGRADTHGSGQTRLAKVE
jgi:hypothetical protein